MSESLPYLASPGSIVKCLERIASAATPDKVTGDFVSTKLAIKGGTGKALVPFLKKVGFVNSDGSPSQLYKRFRNQTESERAVAEAIRIGYSALYSVNEYCHDLSHEELRGIVVHVTGQELASAVVQLTVSTFEKMKTMADFESAPGIEENEPPNVSHSSMPATAPVASSRSIGKMGMNLSYTINLNLPATSDIAVFNAIFKSLKENLLGSDEIE